MSIFFPAPPHTSPFSSHPHTRCRVFVGPQGKQRPHTGCTFSAGLSTLPSPGPGVPAARTPRSSSVKLLAALSWDLCP